MSDQVRRGRRVVLLYVTVSLVVMLALAAMGLRQRRRTGRLFVRLFTHAMLLNSLWRGSQWARGLHVFGLTLGGGWAGLICSRIAHPGAKALLGGLAALCLFTAWQLAFSRDVRAFFASQRGQPMPEPLPVDAGEPAQVRVETARDDSGELRDRAGDARLEDDRVACRQCGARMKSFVVCCPECGSRRE